MCIRDSKSTMLEEIPSIGQLYGSWGYELINRIEPSVPINEIPENNIPYGSWMFFDQLVVFDQIKRCITAVVYADTTSSKDSHGVFLESVEGGENLGRWSIVATKPLWEAVCYGEEIVKTWNNGKTETHKGDPFDILRSWTNEYKSTMLDDLPSIGQLYGSWGYELINLSLIHI